MSLAETIALLGKLVAYPSVSSDSNLPLVHELANLFEGLGAAVEIMPSPCTRKANLVARLGPDAPHGLLLSGHTDVVPVEGQVWTSDPFGLREEGGRLYGRGTCDMKGFIAAAIMAATDKKPAGPVRFALTYDEEVGCLGARALIPELAAQGVRPDVVIVGEPTGMQVVDGHKGCSEYTVEFQGRAGHGSDPASGVNAVEYAARYVSKLLELRATLMARAAPDSPFDPPWSTLNVGRIAGGSAHNVIAEHGRVDWEMRPVSAGDRDLVLRVLRDEIFVLETNMQAIAAEARIKTTQVGDVPGLRPTPQNAARDTLLALVGGSAGLVPFNTEAGLFQSLGSDVVVCGPGHIAQAHTADEYLEISQLEACRQTLGQLMTQA